MEFNQKIDATDSFIMTSLIWRIKRVRRFVGASKIGFAVVSSPVICFDCFSGGIKSKPSGWG